MARLPTILVTIQKTLLRLVPSDLLDEHLTWIHWAQYAALRTKQHDAFFSVTAAEERRVLAKAQHLLVPLSLDPACRRKRWTDTELSLDSPYGAYHWGFHVEMVQELLWLFSECVAGYRFGRTPKDPYRDANPCKAESSRRRSWDCGYILGLANPAKVRRWLQEQSE